MLSTELLAHYRHLAQPPLTVVDVETTGKYADRNRITEVSVLQATLADGILHQQTDLVNSDTLIPESITRFTGISQEMVDAAAPAAEVFPRYLPLLNQGILTGHNLEFDYAFLQAEYARLGTRFDRPDSQQLCTVKLSRLMLADLPSRSLPNLVQHFGFAVERSHRAEADTIACWLLAKHLLTEIVEKPDEVTIAKFARQWIPLRYAAKILGCYPSEARSKLEAIGAKPRSDTRSKTASYRRGDVERVAEGQSHDTQLSWF